MQSRLLFLLFFCPSLMWGTELSEIDAKINELRAALQNNKKEKMEEDLAAQGHMIADWEKYSQDIQNIQSKEAEAKRLIQQIQELEKRKAELQQKSSL